MLKHPIRLALVGAAALLPILGAWGCGLPHDAAGTLERVRGGTLRVGYTVHPPWVMDGGARPTGIEPELVRRWARELDARVEWVQGSEAQLIPRLRRRELDLVIGGLAADSPWSGDVSFSQPYAEVRSGPDGTREAHVIAVAPGESALAIALDRFLQPRRSEIARALGRLGRG